MKKIFSIYSNTLKSGVNFFVGHSFKEINRFLKQRKHKELEEEFSTATNGLFRKDYNKNEDKNFYIIWLPKFKQDKETLLTACHEIHHFIEEVSNEKGFEFETKAYLFEFVLGEFIKETNFKY